MNRRKSIYIIVAVAVALVFISSTAFVGPVSANICTKNQDRVSDRLVTFVNSDLWKHGRAKLDSQLTPEQLVKLNDLVSAFLIRNGDTADSPLHPYLVSFIVGVYEILAILIGNNFFTEAFTCLITSVLVIPAILVIDTLAGFLVIVPLVIAGVLANFPDAFNLQGIINHFGIIGATLYAIIILPLLVIVCLGAICILFPTLLFPALIKDFFQTYLDAVNIIESNLPPTEFQTFIVAHFGYGCIYEENNLGHSCAVS